jgi:polyhydroxybutyrate depolymerase
MPEGERTALRYVPASYDGETPMPLVVSLHSFITGAVVHNRLIGFDELAEANGFITVTPDGEGPPSGLDDGNDLPIWNVVGNPALPDDAAFVLATIDGVTDQLCVDLDRVYLAGMSNGSHLASELVCDHADQFAAVAAVGGFLTPAGCHPSRPLPLVAFHGTDDDYVHYDGGLGDGLKQLNAPDELFDVRDEAYDGVTIPPVEEAASAWARRNGCHGDADVQEVSDEIELRAWSDCPPVQLYVVDGGGQSWPGSELFVAVEATSGYTTMDIDASQLIWDFFVAHPLAG